MSQTAPISPGDPGSASRHHKESTSWMIGIVLILLGVAFLLQNAGYVVMTGNWWAVFIYLASFASLVNAWRVYRSKSAFDSQATGSLIWGLVLMMVATIFLFNLAWDTWWPVILIAVGAGIIVGYVLRPRESE